MAKLRLRIPLNSTTAVLAILAVLRGLITSTGNPNSFWLEGSPVCSKRPPKDAGRLGAGELHWAYMSGQSEDSNFGRPLLLDPFVPGTSEFDPALWDRKAIILRIDGSARVLRMSLTDNKVKDGSGHDIVSWKADAWRDPDVDPALLLKQPEPAP